MSTSKQAKETPPSLLPQLEEITHIVRRWTAYADDGGDDEDSDRHDDDDDVSYKNVDTQKSVL